MQAVSIQVISQNAYPIGGYPSTGTIDSTSGSPTKGVYTDGSAQCPWTVQNCGANDEAFSFHGGGCNSVFVDGSVRLPELPRWIRLPAGGLLPGRRAWNCRPTAATPRERASAGGLSRYLTKRLVQEGSRAFWFSTSSGREAPPPRPVGMLLER